MTTTTTNLFSLRPFFFAASPLTSLVPSSFPCTLSLKPVPYLSPQPSRKMSLAPYPLPFPGDPSFFAHCAVRELRERPNENCGSLSSDGKRPDVLSQVDNDDEYDKAREALIRKRRVMSSLGEQLKIWDYASSSGFSFFLSCSLIPSDFRSIHSGN